MKLFSKQVGLIYVFNLIVGTGALALPAVFSQAGWLLGLIVVLVLAFIRYVCQRDMLILKKSRVNIFFNVKCLLFFQFYDSHVHYRNYRLGECHTDVEEDSAAQKSRSCTRFYLQWSGVRGFWLLILWRYCYLFSLFFCDAYFSELFSLTNSSLKTILPV